MDVLQDKITKTCDSIIKHFDDIIVAVREIDTYLMGLYMDQEINGFSKLSITNKNGEDGIYFGIQLPGFHGMNGWVDCFITLSNKKKVFNAFDQAMKGI